MARRLERLVLRGGPDDRLQRHGLHLRQSGRRAHPDGLLGRRFSKTVNGTTVYYLFDEARRGHGRAIGHTPAAAIALPQAGMYGLHCTQMPIIYEPLVLLSVPSAPPESQSQ